jgi:glycosyltransferase involved in cell wall biosynthesis
VAFDYGAAREHLTDGVHGAAIGAGDEAGFIAACARISADDLTRGAMRMATRQAVAALRPERVAADFDALLLGLAQSRAAMASPPATESAEQEAP